MDKLTSMFGSFGKRSSSKANASSTGLSPGVKKIPSSEMDKVIQLSLDQRHVKKTNNAMTRLCKIPGVSSVALDVDGYITVTGTVDSETVQNKLRNYRPMIRKVALRKEHDSDEDLGSEKSMKGNKKLALDEEFTREEVYISEMPSPICNWERSDRSDDSQSEDDNTIDADKSTTIAPNRRHLNDDWYSLCEFLGNRTPPLNPHNCSAYDVISFLRTRRVPGSIEALVDRLRFSCEAFGVRPEVNPFCSLSVTSYVARVMSRETESILVFSCNDNLDVDETSLIEAISNELHKREITPLTYNVWGREKLDEKMLYRSRVGIMILSNSYVCSRQSLDHLVAIMEHWKTTDLVIIPIYFKITLSDICGLKGRFEAAFLQLQRSLQEDKFRNGRRL